MRVLVIEKAAVKQNIRVVKRRAGGAAVYGVLSGDAGGAGIAEMAELLRAEGIGRFAVSEAEEAASADFAPSFGVLWTRRSSCSAPPPTGRCWSGWWT